MLVRAAGRSIEYITCLASFCVNIVQCVCSVVEVPSPPLVLSTWPLLRVVATATGMCLEMNYPSCTGRSKNNDV